MVNLSVKGIHFSLEIPIYTQDVLFIMGYDRQRAAKLVARYGGSAEIVDFVRSLKVCKGVVTQDGETGKYLVWLEDLPRRASEHATLVHELFHLTEHILDRVGMKHQPYISSEAYAYLLGQITMDVLTRIWTATNL